MTLQAKKFGSQCHLTEKFLKLVCVTLFLAFRSGFNVMYSDYGFGGTLMILANLIKTYAPQ